MTQIIYIKPRSAFQYPLYSDTIFGAMCAGIRTIYGNECLEDLIDRFKGEKIPFLVSSAFPFVEYNNKKVHFFPKPITKLPEIKELDRSESDYEYRDKLKKSKDFNKVKYVSEDLFNKLISGEIKDIELIENLKSKYEVKSGLLFNKINKKLDFKIITLDSARNKINRFIGTSEEIFYSTGTYFKNAGLFFIINYFENYYKKIIESALRFLEDKGIGGDTSVGRGQFECKIEDNNTNLIKEPEEPNAILTLSLYHPSEEEIEKYSDKEIWYKLLTRKGRSFNGCWKKSIKLFVEGSTFPDIELDKYGSIENVLEQKVSGLDHDILEYGIAFPIKIKR
ncbi:MAG: type III-A CRISPR-associated RAMP protein Csm4 [Methanosarcinales archaeon]